MKEQDALRTTYIQNPTARLWDVLVVWSRKSQRQGGVFVLDILKVMESTAIDSIGAAFPLRPRVALLTVT